MTSIARHYTARFVHPSSLPHRPASTIHAYSNPNQITVQFSAAPTPERDTVSFWGPIGKTHPVLGRKLGRVGRSYAKIAAAVLAIGLALALCAPFATYRSEQSFIDGAENGFGIDVILSWVQEHLDGCEDPRRASNGKQLQGTDSGWRWRVGVYRILARIEDGKAVIEVVRVGHRQGVYKSMPRL